MPTVVASTGKNDIDIGGMVWSYDGVEKIVHGRAVEYKQIDDAWASGVSTAMTTDGAIVAAAAEYNRVVAQRLNELGLLVAIESDTFSNEDAAALKKVAGI